MPVKLKPRNIRKYVHSFRVTSCVDGNMKVSVEYRDEPLEEGAPPAGVMTRMAIAREIETALNEIAQTPRGKL